MESKNLIYFLYDYVFPNGYLPNALDSNLAIINYMDSQHRAVIDNPHGECFTDPGQSSVVKDIFNNQIGDWPNSWSITNLNALETITNISYESVYEGRKKANHYFYVIKISPQFDQFAAHGVLQYPKLNGNYFWKYMSHTALEDVRAKRATIILDLAQENYIEKEHYENFHKALEFSGIPPTQIILVFNTFNGTQIYDSWFKPHERKLQVRNWPFVMWNSSKYYAGQKRWKPVKEKKRKRPNYFLFKVKSPREHRKAMLYSLHSEEILNKGDWSYLSDDLFSDNELKSIKRNWNLNYNTEIHSLRSQFPKQLKNEPQTTMHNVSAWTDTTKEPYRNSYFYICSETYYHGEHKSLTEKVFKPIGNYQPFFLLAFPHSLKLLRDLGFKTFSPYIDESYDSELDVTIRLKMVVQEVKRLCSMSQDEIHEWYWNMQDILEHNRNHLVQIYKHEPLTKNFVKFLQEKSKSVL